MISMSKDLPNNLDGPGEECVQLYSPVPQGCEVLGVS
jgi:hypothetical protein